MSLQSLMQGFPIKEGDPAREEVELILVLTPWQWLRGLVQEGIRGCLTSRLLFFLARRIFRRV